ncbi:MAG: hypothetical protein IPJ82_11850 [Lewinellaceae bacterium]|nr:hypothetical protein [Lewinellaceae bacterium]
MKKPVLLVILLFSVLSRASAQVTCDPVFPAQSDNVTIYFNATEGNGALAGFAGPVYAHMGVVTNLSTPQNYWQHVVTNWGTADPLGLMTSAGPNLWKKNLHHQHVF